MLQPSRWYVLFLSGTPGDGDLPQIQTLEGVAAPTDYSTGIRWIFHLYRSACSKQYMLSMCSPFRQTSTFGQCGYSRSPSGS